MEPVSKINCLKVGFFQKPHGVFGTLLLNFDEGLEEKIENSQIFFVEMDGILVPWFVAEDGIRITSSKTALIDFDWIDDDNDAKKLVKKPVWLLINKNEEVKPVEEGSGWIGYEVFVEKKEFLGIIREINDYAGNLVLTIENNSREMLIPFHSDLVSCIDDVKRTITFNLPDGLIDI
jgi:16S rRNA processing protein RimM